jgi:hypothetical protein
VYQMCGQEVLEVGTTFDLGEVAGAQFSKEIVPRVSLPKIEDKHGVSVESVEHEVQQKSNCSFDVEKVSVEVSVDD